MSSVRRAEARLGMSPRAVPLELEDLLERRAVVDGKVSTGSPGTKPVRALLGRTTARGKMSGVEVDMPPWAQVWTLRDRRVVRMRIYPSTPTPRSRRAAGVAAGSASPGDAAARDMQGDRSYRRRRSASRRISSSLIGLRP